MAKKNETNESKLVSNFWRVIFMTAGAILLTIFLITIASQVQNMTALKVFLFVIALISTIFSVITMITSCIAVYFKITTFDTDKAKEATVDIISEIVS